MISFVHSPVASINFFTTAVHSWFIMTVIHFFGYHNADHACLSIAAGILALFSIFHAVCDATHSSADFIDFDWLPSLFPRRFVGIWTVACGRVG